MRFNRTKNAKKKKKNRSMKNLGGNITSYPIFIHAKYRKYHTISMSYM